MIPMLTLRSYVRFIYVPTQTRSLQKHLDINNGLPRRSWFAQGASQPAAAV